MSFVIWVVRVLFFIVMFAFAARNLTPVEVQGFLGYAWKAPLALVLLATFLIGVLFGIYGTLRMWWSLKSVRPRSQYTATQSASKSVNIRNPKTTWVGDEGA